MSMKFLSKILFIIVTLSLILNFSPKFAFAAENIEDYKVNINIKQDATLNIKEQIQYDFGNEYRHGIYRELPYVWENAEGKKYEVELDVREVSYANGNSVPYSTSRDGQNLVLKIGDPDKTITGSNTYIISYQAKGAVLYFDDHDEIYWDAIGTGWEVPIENSTITINLSDFSDLELDKNDVVCYTGLQNSKTSNCEVSVTGNIIQIKSNGALQSNEGLTFAVKIPKGYVDYYPAKEYKGSILPIILFILSFLLNFVLSAGVIVWWFLKGRDPKDDRIIVRMYDSPKDDNGKELTPLEVGTIVDEKADYKDISAELIYLAIHKYLILSDGEKKKVTIRRGPKLESDLEMTSLKDHQKALIKALGLNIKESIELKRNTNNSKMASEITKLMNELYKKLANDGYFKGNPNNIRLKFLLFGFGLMFLTLFIPGILMILFSFIMPRKTKKGVEAKRHGLGLLQFLKSQDRQFEFQEKNFYLFEKLLPYAISFGVAKIWAKKFEDLYDYRPDWYESSSVRNFTTYSMLNSIERNLKSVESGYSYSSSTGHSSGFSGGGFSGGGAGGGGGGSW